MPKRKTEDAMDEGVRSKKAKIVSGVGAVQGVILSGESSTDQRDAMDAVPQEQKNKRKAVETDAEDEDDHNMEEAEGEVQAEGDEQDDEDVAGPSTSSKTSTHKLRKLAPPRPYPTVPTSVSATGPRSSHSEGKNYICVTRKTPLGAYLRRCKDVVMKDGYKSLHLNAMGAAVPHLLQLSVSLPSILPHPPEDIHTEVRTGTVEVQDELIPEDEDEDISYQTRGKSTLSVVIKIGDGVDEVLKLPKNKSKGRNANHAAGRQKGHPPQKKGGQKGREQGGPQQVVIREQDMDDG